MTSLGRLKCGFAGRLLQPCGTAFAIRMVRDLLQARGHGKERIVEVLWALSPIVGGRLASVFFAVELALFPQFQRPPFSVGDTVDLFFLDSGV